MTASGDDVEFQDRDAESVTEQDAEGIAQYLRAHPDFLTERPDLLRDLTPPSRWDGDAVVDLQSMMLDRLREESQDLRDAANLLIATTRSNILIQTRTHAGVMALLGADGLERILHVIRFDLPLLLDVDAVSLCLETGETGSAALGAGEIQWLAGGSADGLLGGADKQFALLEDASDNGAVFGETAGLVRSAAYVRINAGDNLPVGILALGARERGAFHPGQGSDLVNFLARVAELCLRRWLPRG
jgi:uncharacterized protein YigA (DUF484 family)